MIIKSIHKGKRLILIYLLLSIPLSLFGRGGEDAVLSPKEAARTLQRVEELIKQGYLDQATLTLVELGQKNPESIEVVNRLIKEINASRIQYDAVYSQLLEALDQGRIEESQELILLLEKMDVDPNSRTRNLLALVRLIAEKKINEALLVKVIEEGNEFLYAGQYSEAVASYHRGFELYRKTFMNFVLLAEDDATGDKAVPLMFEKDPQRWDKVRQAYLSLGRPIANLIQELDASLAAWEGSYDETNLEVKEKLEFLGSSSPADWSFFFADMEKIFSREDELYQRVLDIEEQVGTYWQDLNQRLDEVPGDFWLYFINIFLLGRQGVLEPEGILVSLDARWNALFEEVLGALEDLLEDRLNQGRNAFATNSWDSALDGYSEATLISREMKNLLRLADYRLALEVEEDKKSELAQNHSALLAYLNELDEKLESWQVLVVLGRDLPPIPPFLRQERIDGLEESSTFISEQITWLKDMENALNQAVSLGTADPRIQSLQTRLAEDTTEIRDAYEKRLTFFLDSAIGFDYEKLLTLIQGLGEESEKKYREYLGISTGDNTGNEPPERYPTRYLNEIILPSQNILDRTEEEIEDSIQQYQELVYGGYDFKNNEDVSFQRVQAVAEATKKQRIVLTSYDQKASNYVRAARRAEAETANDFILAENYYQEALEFLDGAKYEEALVTFDLSLAALEDVLTGYLKIYENDRDIAGATGFEEKREELISRITTSRRGVAVQMARSTINEARLLYEEGVYREGLNLVSRTKEFWEKTRGEANAELDRLEIRFLDAEKALSQSQINTENPLYTEMSQYMNLALKYYLVGKKLNEESSNQSESMEAFDIAAEFIAQVKRVFPRNSEVLTLEQKILKETFPEKFAEEARALINEVRGIILQGETDRAWETLPKLQSLEEIAPELEGLIGLISDLEIFLGLKDPPPDPIKLERSSALTEESQQLWEEAVEQARGAFVADRVRELLDEALEINPNNIQAAALKDNIARSVGGNIVVTLSINDQLLFRRAQEFYAQANYPQAWALIRKLLDENLQNTRYAPLKELERRVQARL